jgi:two-component system, OmpR family, sensor histidine kinase BaeS
VTPRTTGRPRRTRDAHDRSRGRRGHTCLGWQGFGCLFGLVFLFVAGSLVAASAFVLSQLGPLPGIVAAAVVLAILVGIGRALRRAGATLDELVEATRRVEAGDYSVRVVTPARGLRPVRQLVSGFDTMAARLEADERQRRALLADVSHELRTPLTVIAGSLEAIMDGIHPADEVHLTPILDQTRVMERLIDDLRTLTLSEAGTLALHREPTAPDLLIAEVVRSYTPVATSARVSLTDATTDDLAIADLDPVRIGEVLSNLVGNAIRHTPPGGQVVVRGSMDSSGRSLIIRVSDTGPGIDPELLPHVFDRFVKGETSGGSGLGLAIAKGLVEAHDGRISITSVPGSGATFTVELPTGA